METKPKKKTIYMQMDISQFEQLREAQARTKIFGQAKAILAAIKYWSEAVLAGKIK